MCDNSRFFAKWLPLLLLLWACPAAAQNTTCATRPAGDSTNACASTAFVHTGFLPYINLGPGVAAALSFGVGTLHGFPPIDAPPVDGNCLAFDALGGINNVACSPSGSGTVGAGFVGNIPVYNGSTSIVGSTVSIAANVAAILTLSTAQATQVLKLGYYAQGDSPPVMYLASPNACPTGASDGGTYFVSSDSKCWVAQWPAGGIDAREYGAICDGSFDTTSRVQIALNAGGTLGLNVIMPTGLCNFQGALSIPGNTGLVGIKRGLPGSLIQPGAQNITASGSGTTLTVSSYPANANPIVLGLQLNGVGVTPGTYINGFISGTGGNGTYSTAQTLPSGSIASATLAPIPFTVMMPFSTSSTFITMAGSGSHLDSLMFWYPTQVFPTAATPTAFPFTITTCVNCGLEKFTNLHAVNAYDFLSIAGGRNWFEDSVVGAFLVGVFVDGAQDWVVINNIMNQVMWDADLNLSYPQTIDTWVQTNSIAGLFERADSVKITNWMVFSRYICMQMSDDNTYNPPNSYGEATGVDCDTVGVGIYAHSTNAPGWRISNINIAGNNTGRGAVGNYGVYMDAGGLEAPYVGLTGCTIRQEATAPFTVSGPGQLYTPAWISNVAGGPTAGNGCPPN